MSSSGISTSFIFSRTSERNSIASNGSSPRAVRIALSDALRK